ncbi:MAG: hypothetical protein KDB80_16105, partial [Planctomycetes bacterium]|nr:hypothetical protein [Planctomycetota bacterium]
LVECLDATDTGRELRHVFIPYCPEVDFVHKAIRQGFAEIVFRHAADAEFAPGVKPKKSKEMIKKEKMKAEMKEEILRKQEAEKERRKNKKAGDGAKTKKQPKDKSDGGKD